MITSGIVFIAKDRYTANAVKFALNKTYIAVCSGIINENGTVNAPIALKKDSKMVREVTSDGAPSVTHYKVLVNGKDCTLVSLVLKQAERIRFVAIWHTSVIRLRAMICTEANSIKFKGRLCTAVNLILCTR